MANIKHSCASDDWYTPYDIMVPIKRTLGYIDLDPASSKEANDLVMAGKYFTKEDDALTMDWAIEPVTIYLNAPGGKIGKKSKPALFWQKLIALRNQGLLRHAIVMGFSLEQLAVTQGCTQSMCDFPLVILRNRVRFVTPGGESSSPTHGNMVVYVPGLRNSTFRFFDLFEKLGKPMMPAKFSSSAGS